ncbi:oxidoreductase domain-containing protein [Stemphylium lycopersici]|uniref:Oxidoreductase domain-containing protein n=1 Tax=Stemphylium lycopersici TaxID=183478 RepID=A0A364MVC9_STELY|nr:oxidoreductase domain-containing protein [Stemphylium lycopersici]RAR04763.1 oxidoreductase domain-containing protein [Stemphylium lycopersici]
MHHLDPHERPPDSIRNVYKKYQKMKLNDLSKDQDIIDLSSSMSASSNSKMRVVREYAVEELTATFRAFAGEGAAADLGDMHIPASIPVYEHEDMPGLHLIPSLLPAKVQSTLLSRLLHRDLCSPSHLTNIHTHYKLSYPPSQSSFFSIPPSSATPIATPLDPAVHKPLTASQLLNKKLRWTTLGGQYDWTEKRYPPTPPPPFPSDTKDLLESLFTSTKAEAAIVNLYSPGDTLSVHRDVAETSSTGLISVSLGCDAIFVLGTSWVEPGGEVQDKVLTLRLRSGSAVSWPERVQTI